VPRPTSDDLSFPDDRHSGNLIRLGRLLEHPGRFRLMLAEHNAPPYRDRIIQWLADRFPRSTTWPVSSDCSADAFIEHLGELGPEQEAVQIVGFEDWPPEAESRLFLGLNYRREDLAATAPLLLVLWLPKEAATRFARKAPDLWAWRTAVLDFALAPPERLDIHDRALAFRGEDAERLRARRQEIAGYLQAKPELGHADGGLLLEAARIHEHLGEWDQALQAAERARAIYHADDDRRGVALALGATADILQARGELDEALRIRTQEELPVYQRLGDVRSTLVCRTNIALNLLERGRVEERAQANELLCLALTDAERLRIPEARQIEAILRQSGMACPPLPSNGRSGADAVANF